MSAPWNRWFHCIGGTYGSWLPGDRRGFRTRHHREHVEGDYRNPPPVGIYVSRHQGAAESLRFDAVTIRSGDRRIICLEMGRVLLAYGAELVDLSVGGQRERETATGVMRQLSRRASGERSGGQYQDHTGSGAHRGGQRRATGCGPASGG